MIHNFTVTFGIPVVVQAKDEADALKAAATLIWADARYYATQVLRHEGDEDRKIADTPPDERRGTV